MKFRKCIFIVENSNFNDFGIQASFISSTFDYVNPEEGSNVFNIDPNNTLGSMADGFVPFPLATNDYTTDPTNPAAGPVLTPGWTKVGASTFFNNNFNWVSRINFL